ncbi:hypothetical protein ACI3EY_08040 [Ornithinimicrobium sp. LYQ92]|uniref:hypothetical protein n=1 Tax=Serinicoccus sp. LYQ92 TaxID=3378798 RepID=UPI003851D190
MPKQNRVSGSSRPSPAASTPGAAFRKDVQQPTAKTKDDAPEFDPTRPATFDLPGFISGAKSHTNTRIMPVTSRPDIAGELAALTYEQDQLVALIEEDKASEGGTPKRLSAKSIRARRIDEIKARIAELEPELDGTWVEIKLRASTAGEQTAVRLLRLPPGIEVAGAVFEDAATIRPAGEGDDAWSSLTAEQWVDLIEVIGIEQYETLDKTHTSLTYQGVTPDFYERYSASRGTRTTSSS